MSHNDNMPTCPECEGKGVTANKGICMACRMTGKMLPLHPHPSVHFGGPKGENIKLSHLPQISNNEGASFLDRLEVSPLKLLDQINGGVDRKIFTVHLSAEHRTLQFCEQDLQELYAMIPVWESYGITMIHQESCDRLIFKAEVAVDGMVLACENRLNLARSLANHLAQLFEQEILRKIP